MFQLRHNSPETRLKTSSLAHRTQAVFLRPGKSSLEAHLHVRANKNKQFFPLRVQLFYSAKYRGHKTSSSLIYRLISSRQTWPQTSPLFVAVAQTRGAAKANMLDFFTCGNPQQIFEHSTVWRVEKWIVVCYTTFKMSHDAIMSG